MGPYVQRHVSREDVVLNFKLVRGQYSLKEQHFQHQITKYV